MNNWEQGPAGLGCKYYVLEKQEDLILEFSPVTEHKAVKLSEIVAKHVKSLPVH